MRTRSLGESGEQAFILVFESGDEVMAGLLSFARDHGLTAGHFTAIGALSDVVLGYFDWEKRDYEPITLTEQVEVLSLVGDIAIKDEAPKPPATIVVRKP